MPREKIIEKPSCCRVEELEDFIKKNNGQPLGVLITLGHNWSRVAGDWPPTLEKGPVLSLSSQISALAAYLLLSLGFTDKIIFSGGKTAGTEYPSEARAMKDYLINILGRYQINMPADISERMILEENSWDTRTNALECHQIIDKSDPTRTVGLMSVGYHINQRAKDIFDANCPGDIDLPLETDSMLPELLELFLESDKISENTKKAFEYEIKYILKYYLKFMSTPIYTDNGEIKLRAHGPEYHLLAKLYQKITNDPAGEKLSNKAAQRRM